LVEHFREDRYCPTCLGIGPCDRPEPRQIAEMSQSYQRHDLMRFLDAWKRKHISPTGVVTELPDDPL